MSDKPEPAGLVCPRCRCTDLRTTNTVPLPGNRIRRYKACRNCGRRLVSIEVPPSQVKPR